ncbi:hypothetical protein SSX86_010603 [Deinandra increscens subsp. villosa]|uniref:Kinesin-like protein n=1 Tax=Deinandra increscens subsp. villosa TaxID=3103831 RepID=A0AAP0DC23_9ASTR
MGTNYNGECTNGIIPKVMHTIFKRVEETKDNTEFLIRVSFIEIFKEEVFDLLDSTPAVHPKADGNGKHVGPFRVPIQIRETANGGISLAGVTEAEVTSQDEMASFLLRSRSHAIFMITMEQKKLSGITSGAVHDDNAGDDILCAKLHLVDLAGSERAKKTGADGMRLREDLRGWQTWKLWKEGLDNLKIGGCMISANLAKSPRKPGSNDYMAPQGSPEKQRFRVFKEVPGPMERGVKSFKQVVTGEIRAEEIQKEVGPCNLKKVVLPDEVSDYPASFFGRALLDEAVDGVALCNIKVLLKAGGESDFDVSYVGGLHVLLVFNDKESAKHFLVFKERWWKVFFKVLDIWVGQSFEQFRMVDIGIMGLPLHLRDDTTCDTIAKVFGSVIWPAQSSWLSGDCRKGKVTILSKCWKEIDETISVVWKRDSFTAQVKEERDSWVPTFEKEETIPAMWNDEGSPEEGNQNSNVGGDDIDDTWSEVGGDLDGLGGSAILGNHDTPFSPCQKLKSPREEEFQGTTSINLSKEASISINKVGGPVKSPRPDFSESRPNNFKSFNLNKLGSLGSKDSTIPYSLCFVEEMRSKGRSMGVEGNSGRRCEEPLVSRGSKSRTSGLRPGGNFGDRILVEEDWETTWAEKEAVEVMEVGRSVGLNFSGCEAQIPKVMLQAAGFQKGYLMDFLCVNYRGIREDSKVVWVNELKRREIFFASATVSAGQWGVDVGRV